MFPRLRRTASIASGPKNCDNTQGCSGKPATEARHRTQGRIFFTKVNAGEIAARNERRGDGVLVERAEDEGRDNKKSAEDEHGNGDWCFHDWMLFGATVILITSAGLLERT